MKEVVSPGLELGLAELAEGRWEAARASFDSALEAGEEPAAIEGLGWAAWWLDDAESVFAARERAFRLYKRRGDPAGAARMATWLACDERDFNGATAVRSGSATASSTRSLPPSARSSLPTIGPSRTSSCASAGPAARSPWPTSRPRGSRPTSSTRTRRRRPREPSHRCCGAVRRADGSLVEVTLGPLDRQLRVADTDREEIDDE